MDRFSRKIVDWHLVEDMTESLVLKALRIAIRTRRPEADLIHHTDRGGQYAGREYRRVLRRSQMRQSMSRADNCYDNAFMESCFGTVKTELEIAEYESHRVAEQELAEYFAYHNRAIATQEVIEELIKLAKELDAATKAGKEMGLTDDEKAFYDALAANDSALTAMGDDKLKVIAAELISQVKKSVTIDWTLREGARAKIKVMVKRILNKYGYPPDLQEDAVRTVLMQAELLCAEWASA